MSENTELEKRYFDETARALRREGFQVEQLQSGQLTMILNDRRIYAADGAGAAFDGQWWEGRLQGAG